MLAEAQRRKIDRLLDRAGVGPGCRVLEVGTGWGELAIRAAAGAPRVLTVTISREQQALAARRVAEAGLAGQVSVELRDYRDIEGEFDAICSVEMLEAVGERYRDAYFAASTSTWLPGGRLGLQTITCAHDRMLATRHTYTWIQKYIFPGGLLPSVTAIEISLAGATRLRIPDARGFRRPLRRDAEASGGTGSGARRRGRPPRLRRGVQPNVETLPVRLRAGFGAGESASASSPGPDSGQATSPPTAPGRVSGLLRRAVRGHAGLDGRGATADDRRHVRRAKMVGCTAWWTRPGVSASSGRLGRPGQFVRVRRPARRWTLAGCRRSGDCGWPTHIGPRNRGKPEDPRYQGCWPRPRETITCTRCG